MEFDTVILPMQMILAFMPKGKSYCAIHSLHGCCLSAYCGSGTVLRTSDAALSTDDENPCLLGASLSEGRQMTDKDAFLS